MSIHNSTISIEWVRMNFKGFIALSLVLGVLWISVVWVSVDYVSRSVKSSSVEVLGR